jgi:hypothetical protein
MTRSSLLATAGLSVVILAGFAWLVAGAPGPEGEAAAPPGSTSPRPAPLRVEPGALDLGDLVPGQPKASTVTLTNTSDAPVRLAGAVPSCGCTAATWSKEPIAPGASTTVEVSMVAGDMQGEVLAKTVTFLVAGAEPVVVPVRGLVGRFVSCSPRQIDAPRDALSADQVLPTDIVLESEDGTAFRVVGVDPAIASSASMTEASLRHDLRVDWDAWRTAGRPDFITVVTDHPRAPDFSVSVRRPVRAAPVPPTPAVPPGA